MALPYRENLDSAINPATGVRDQYVSPHQNTVNEMQKLMLPNGPPKTQPIINDTTRSDYEEMLRQLRPSAASDPANIDLSRYSGKTGTKLPGYDKTAMAGFTSMVDADTRNRALIGDVFKTLASKGSSEYETQLRAASTLGANALSMANDARNADLRMIEEERRRAEDRRRGRVAIGLEGWKQAADDQRKSTGVAVYPDSSTMRSIEDNADAAFGSGGSPGSPGSPASLQRSAADALLTPNTTVPPVSQALPGMMANPEVAARMQKDLRAERFKSAEEADGTLYALTNNKSLTEQEVQDKQWGHVKDVITALVAQGTPDTNWFNEIWGIGADRNVNADLAQMFEGLGKLPHNERMQAAREFLHGSTPATRGIGANIFTQLTAPYGAWTGNRFGDYKDKDGKVVENYMWYDGSNETLGKQEIQIGNRKYKLSEAMQQLGLTPGLQDRSAADLAAKRLEEDRRALRGTIFESAPTTGMTVPSISGGEFYVGPNRMGDATRYAAQTIADAARAQAEQAFRP